MQKSSSVRTIPSIEHVRAGLRPWQQQALDKCLRLGNRLLVVATPGSGKTHFALAFAATLLAKKDAERIVVVTPSRHLKHQWQEAAIGLGLSLSTQIESREPADHHGTVTTFHEVYSQAVKHRTNARHEKTVVILDEVHHASEGNGWGRQLSRAFDLSDEETDTIVLSLSGTPFRSDNNTIPFIAYENGTSKADYTLTYAEALNERYVRDIYFPSWEGKLEWFSNVTYETIQANFSTELEDDRQKSERLKTALLTDWSEQVIAEADSKLQELREQGHGRACGLIVCMDIAHAQMIALRVREITDFEPDLIVSDSKDAHERLRSISEGKRRARWIVSVQMISEGVDIPDLRVAVYLTNRTTELFFRQFAGRIVRKIQDCEVDSDAHMYIPNDDTIVEMARHMQQEREHVVGKVEDSEGSRVQSLERQISMFAPNAGEAVSAGTIFGAETITAEEIEESRAFARDIDYAGPIEKIARALRKRARSEPPEAKVTQREKTAAELRRELRKACDRKSKRACIANQYDFRAVNRWLNQQTRVKTIAESTVDQLKARLRLIEQVLAQGQWRGD